MFVPFREKKEGAGKERSFHDAQEKTSEKDAVEAVTRNVSGEPWDPNL